MRLLPPIVWLSLVTASLSSNNSLAEEVSGRAASDGSSDSPPFDGHRSPSHNLNPAHDPSHREKIGHYILNAMGLTSFGGMASSKKFGGKGSGGRGSSGKGSKGIKVSNVAFAAAAGFSLSDLIFSIVSDEKEEARKWKDQYTYQTQLREQDQRLYDERVSNQWRIGNETAFNLWNSYDDLQKAMHAWAYECKNSTRAELQNPNLELAPECQNAMKWFDENHPEWSEEQRHTELVKICGADQLHRDREHSGQSDACSKNNALHMQYLSKVPPEYRDAAIIMRITLIEDKLQTLGLAIFLLLETAQNKHDLYSHIFEYLIDNMEWKANVTMPRFPTPSDADAALDDQFWNPTFMNKLYEIAVTPQRYNDSLPFEEFLKNNNYTWDAEKYAAPPWEDLHPNITNPYYTPKDFEVDPKTHWKVIHCDDWEGYDAKNSCREKEPCRIDKPETESGEFFKGYDEFHFVCKQFTGIDPALGPETVWEPKEIWRYDGCHHGFPKHRVSVACGRIEPGAQPLKSPMYHDIPPHHHMMVEEREVSEETSNLLMPLEHVGSEEREHVGSEERDSFTTLRSEA